MKKVLHILRASAGAPKNMVRQSECGCDLLHIAIPFGGWWVNKSKSYVRISLR